jgi:hypothetical protein
MDKTTPPKAVIVGTEPTMDGTHLEAIQTNGNHDPND